MLSRDSFICTHRQTDRQPGGVLSSKTQDMNREGWQCPHLGLLKSSKRTQKDGSRRRLNYVVDLRKTKTNKEKYLLPSEKSQSMLFICVPQSYANWETDQSKTLLVRSIIISTPTPTATLFSKYMQARAIYKQKSSHCLAFFALFSECIFVYLPVCPATYSLFLSPSLICLKTC